MQEFLWLFSSRRTFSPPPLSQPSSSRRESGKGADAPGLALRVQGLRRFHGIRFTRAGALQIVRVRDEDVVVLAETEFELTFDETLKVVASVRGNRITATVNDVAIAADDGDPVAQRDGGIGLFIHEGALSTNAIAISG